MTGLKRINLDYQISPDQPRRLAGWMLLVAGLALLGEMGISYDRLHGDLAAMNKEARSSRLRLDAPRREGARHYTDQDFQAAEQIRGRLSVNWERLFADLESVKNNNVAILSFEPDLQTGLLRLSGEGKDFPSLLTLVAQLRTRKSFSEVFLQQHEEKRDDPQHPVSFVISLRWGKPL